MLSAFCIVLSNIIFLNSSVSLQKYSEYPPTLTTRFLCSSGFLYASCKSSLEMHVICICIPPISIYDKISAFNISLFHFSSILKFKTGTPTALFKSIDVTLSKGRSVLFDLFQKLLRANRKAAVPPLFHQVLHRYTCPHPLGS